MTETIPEEILEEMIRYMDAYVEYRFGRNADDPSGLLAKLTADLRALGFSQVFTHDDVVRLILED